MFINKVKPIKLRLEKIYENMFAETNLYNSLRSI